VSFHVRFATIACVAVLTACSTPPTDPGPQPPAITIHGVEDGGSYLDPVTIQIHVDRGSWEARLNGERITSGHQVERPGDYELVVTAQEGIATARQEVSFEIALDGDSRLIVRMINLGAHDIGGGGDAILLTDSSGLGRVHMLVDAGPGPGGFADSLFVRQRLQSYGVDTLAVLLLTHAHADHYAGMNPILRDLHVQRFVYNGQVRFAQTYQALLTVANQHADSVIVAAELREYDFGHGSDAATRFTVIPPLPTWIGQHTDDGAELNEGSLGTYVERGDFTFFLTGDGEYAANQRWRTQFADYTAGIEVLKVGHHGANNAIFDSGNSGPSNWLTHTDPRVALITANGTTHPRINALTRLHSLAGLEVYCTHVHGTVELRVSPTGRYRLDVEPNPGAACTPGSAAST
jgi:competence protein ComEC